MSAQQTRWKPSRLHRWFGSISSSMDDMQPRKLFCSIRCESCILRTGGGTVGGCFFRGGPQDTLMSSEALSHRETRRRSVCRAAWRSEKPKKKKKAKRVTMSQQKMRNKKFKVPWESLIIRHPEQLFRNVLPLKQAAEIA